MKLEQLQKGARVRGLAVEGIATVKSVEFFGGSAVEVIFTDAHGAPHTRIVTREDEPSLDLVEASRPWSFDADGDLFRLVSEARRIALAWLFDPYVAIGNDFGNAQRFDPSKAVGKRNAFRPFHFRVTRSKRGAIRRSSPLECNGS